MKDFAFLFVPVFIRDRERGKCARKSRTDVDRMCGQFCLVAAAAVTGLTYTAEDGGEGAVVSWTAPNTQNTDPVTG